MGSGAFYFMHYTSLLLIVCLFLCSSCVKEIAEEAEEHRTPLPSSPQEEEELVPLMNLLKNGNCEDWIGMPVFKPGNYMNYWSLKDNKGTVYQERDTVYEGKYSAKLYSHQTGITSFISQTINVNPGHHIRINFHYQMSYESGTGARMYCYFRESRSTNIPNHLLKTFYDEETLQIIRGGGYGIPNFTYTNNTWASFDYTIRVPAIAYYFVFEIHSYAGTTFYVDDCYIVDVDM